MRNAEKLRKEEERTIFIIVETKAFLSYLFFEIAENKYKGVYNLMHSVNTVKAMSTAASWQFGVHVCPIS